MMVYNPVSGNRWIMWLVRALGIEPRTPAWKAGVLPLNYARFKKVKVNASKGLGSRAIASS